MSIKPQTPYTTERRGATLYVVDAEGLLVAKVYDWPEKGAEQANAHLIAAAPELLAALKDFVSDFEQLRSPGFTMKATADKARAAIRKAEGE